MKSNSWKCILFLLVMASCIQAQQEGQIQSYKKAETIEGYARLCLSTLYKSYKFFTRTKPSYDLDVDVLSHPGKKILYLSMEHIEQLFDDANRYDNPVAQIRALLLLCRAFVPVWYVKNFQKGLDVLVKNCCDEQGNFVHVGCKIDIRLIFKDYYRKAPASWQRIAQMSDWWFRKINPYTVCTSYYAFTCTVHNEELLAMIEAALVNDKKCLEYLVEKNGSCIASKIYEHYLFTQFKKYNTHEGREEAT